LQNYGASTFTNLQCDTVFQYCVDVEGAGTQNYYAPATEWNNSNMTGSRDWYFGLTTGVPGYSEPQAVNISGEWCGSVANQPGYAHFDSGAGVIDSSVGSDGAVLPSYVHDMNAVYCNQLGNGFNVLNANPTLVGTNIGISNGAIGAAWNFGITGGPLTGAGAGASIMNLTNPNSTNTAQLGVYQFNLQNPTTATSSHNYNSPIYGLCGTYYGSSISNPLCVTQQLTFASGSSPASTYHTAGASGYTWDNPITLPNGSVATTQTSSDNTTKVATDAFVQSNLSSYAPLASPALTGTPTVPTATAGTNTTQAASTAFVLANATSSNTTPNLNAFYLSPNCGGQANCTTANANTKQCSDATITNSSATVTSTACANFTSADIGKRIWAFATCSTDASATLAAIIGSTTAATISAVGSSTSITISQNATGSQSSTGCIIYGTPDDTAQSNLETAVSSTSAAYCPGIQFPAGGMMWTSWHLDISQPPGCARNPEVKGSTVFGGGFNVAGQGRTQSVIYIDPLISMTCTGQCMYIPPNAEWHDFSFNGGNSSRTGLTSAKVLLSAGGYSVLRNMGFTNFGYADNNLIGWYGSSSPPIYCINSDFDGWGSTSVKLDPGWLYSTGCSYQDSLGGTQGVSSLWLSSTGSGDQVYSLHDLFTTQSNNSGPVTVIYNNNGGSYVQLAYGNIGAQNATQSTNGYSHYSTGSAWIIGMLWRLNTATAQNIGVAAGTSATGIYLRDNIFQLSSSGNWINFENSGTVVHDLGGNVVFNGANIQTGSGVWSNGLLVPYASVNGSCTGTATASSTLGLYGTGPNVTATTCTSATIGAGQVMTHAGTLGYFQVTAGTAGHAAGSGVFTVYQNGSATSITCTVGTGTSCYDGTHQVSFANGDLISIEFTTQASETLAGIKAVLSAY
jgi:hypothetical protein